MELIFGFFGIFLRLPQNDLDGIWIYGRLNIIILSDLKHSDDVLLIVDQLLQPLLKLQLSPESNEV